MEAMMAAMLGGSALSGIGSLIGGGMKSAANSSAANLSAILQAQGLAQVQNMFNQGQAALSPYYTQGSNALTTLMGYLTGTGAQQAGIGGGGSNLLSTFAPTMDQLAQTPGYQFSLQQGTQAAQNAAAAKGLGVSGNALKSGVDYAQGLASTTFQQQLQNYLTQNQQAYNMLLQPAQLGETAAGQLSQLAGQTGGQLMSGFTNIGNTLGAGITGAANAASTGVQSALSGVGNALSSAGTVAAYPQLQAQINALTGGQGATGGGVSPSGPAGLWSWINNTNSGNPLNLPGAMPQ